MEECSASETITEHSYQPALLYSPQAFHIRNSNTDLMIGVWDLPPNLRQMDNIQWAGKKKKKSGRKRMELFFFFFNLKSREKKITTNTQNIRKADVCVKQEQNAGES